MIVALLIVIVVKLTDTPSMGMFLIALNFLRKLGGRDDYIYRNLFCK